MPPGNQKSWKMDSPFLSYYELCIRNGWPGGASSAMGMRAQILFLSSGRRHGTHESHFSLLTSEREVAGQAGKKLGPCWTPPN